MKNCEWFTYAAKELNCEAFAIGTMGLEHACGKTFYHKHANSEFLARYYMEFLRLNRKVTWSAFKEKSTSGAKCTYYRGTCVQEIRENQNFDPRQL